MLVVGDALISTEGLRPLHADHLSVEVLAVGDALISTEGLRLIEGLESGGVSIRRVGDALISTEGLRHLGKDAEG